MARQNDRNQFHDVMRAVRRQRPALFMFSLFANLLLLTAPLYMLQVFDRVLSSGSYDTLIWLTLMAIGALAVYGLMEQVRKRLLSRIGAWVDRELSPEVIKRAVRSKLSSRPVEAGFEDVADLRAFLGGDAKLAFLDAPWIPVFIGVIWLLHPLLAAIALAGAVALFAIALLNDWLTRSKQGTLNQKSRSSGSAAGQFIESAETISPLGMTGALVSRWKAKRTEMLDQGVSLADTNAGLYNLSRFIRFGLQIAVLGTGAALILNAQLTPGGMIASSILLSRALAPVERSITAWRSYASFRVARAHLEELFRSEPMEEAAFALPRPEGRLVVEGVRYMPAGASVPVIKKVDFQLAPGEVCGLIGPSGSGKSTLCKLIVGAWRPDFGSVRLDGADVSGWDPEKLGPYLGYLPQEVDLFPGTVAENIARMQDAPERDVVAAARLAGVHDTILEMPEGYDTQVGLHGSFLSGGQRQRVALARAFFGNPELIVLDEPNSNLDGDGEVALMRAMAALKAAGRTMIVVAHQPGVLRFADKVLVLKGGTVAKFGPRGEVLKSLLKRVQADADGDTRLKPSAIKSETAQ